MPTPKPYVAFAAAALALLVLPVLVMAGLMAIGLASGAGMMSQMRGVMDGDAAVVLSLFVVWTTLVVIAVLAAITLMVRRARRSLAPRV
jgi:hypothetical protein